jgi:hypothetical protein
MTHLANWPDMPGGPEHGADWWAQVGMVLGARNHWHGPKACPHAKACERGFWSNVRTNSPHGAHSPSVLATHHAYRRFGLEVNNGGLAWESGIHSSATEGERGADWRTLGVISHCGVAEQGLIPGAEGERRQWTGSRYKWAGGSGITVDVAGTPIAPRAGWVLSPATQSSPRSVAGHWVRAFNPWHGSDHPLGHDTHSSPRRGT